MVLQKPRGFSMAVVTQKPIPVSPVGSATDPAACWSLSKSLSSANLSAPVEARMDSDLGNQEGDQS